LKALPAILGQICVRAESRMDRGRVTPGVFTGDSQHIIFLGLTHGTVYTVQVRSLGGVPGQSDWSNQAPGDAVN
jgi:hypothetical protein